MRPQIMLSEKNDNPFLRTELVLSDEVQVSNKYDFARPQGTYHGDGVLVLLDALEARSGHVLGGEEATRSRHLVVGRVSSGKDAKDTGACVRAFVCTHGTNERTPNENQMDR